MARSRAKYLREWIKRHPGLAAKYSRAYRKRHPLRVKRRERKYRQTHKEQLAIRWKRYYEDNKERLLPSYNERAKQWQKQNRQYRALWFRKYRMKNPGINAAYNRKVRLELKTIVYRHYGNKCQCCGETEWEFLSIDHVNQDGHKERKLHIGGGAIYRHIRNQGFPKSKYRILCFNCNQSARYGNGTCIHKRRKSVL